MKILYVAGKYRSSEGMRGVWENIEIAGSVAVQLWRMGFAVICPHKNTAFFDGVDDAKMFITGDLEMIKRCDGVVTCPNWKNSEGAREEVHFSKSRAIPVYAWPKDRKKLVALGKPK